MRVYRTADAWGARRAGGRRAGRADSGSRVSEQTRHQDEVRRQRDVRPAGSEHRQSGRRGRRDHVQPGRGERDDRAAGNTNWTALGNPPGRRRASGTRIPSGATCKKVRVTATSIKGIVQADGARRASVRRRQRPADLDRAGDRHGDAALLRRMPQRRGAEGNPQQLTKFRECLAPATSPATAPLRPTPTATPTPTQTPEQVGAMLRFRAPGA